MSDDARRKGLEKMKEVYGWDMPDLPGDFFGLTVEHLFGTIWTRPELSVRDRRLLLLGSLATQGIDDLLEIQVNAALSNEELTVAELREIALFITHYIGWPKGQKVNSVVEKVVAKRQKGDGTQRQPWESKRG
jgi:4-carboxymuconolactone decarboxylase